MSSPDFPDEPPYEIEFYETATGKEPAADFIWGLPEAKRAALVAAIDTILRQHGKDVCETEHGKNLRKGLYEFRFRDTGMVLRLYFHAYGNKMLLLLAGYDKGRWGDGKRQRDSILAARGYLDDWKRANRR